MTELPKAPSNAPDQASRPLTFDLDDLKALIAGSLPPEQAQALLQGRDRRGMSAVGWAAVKAAAAAESLTPLLSLLDPSPEEESASRQILDLLAAQAEALVRMEKRMVALDLRVIGIAARFPTH